MFEELREYVTENHGDDGWEAVLDEAGLGSRSYMSLSTYPDEELLAIVDAGVAVTGATKAALLTDFGQYASGDLMARYNAFLEDDWGALDVLANTEDAMHRAVRLKEEDASPPELVCERTGDDEVVIEYASDHQLCKLGEGLIQGVADEYDTQLSVTQQQCMLEGDRVCEIHVRR